MLRPYHRTLQIEDPAGGLNDLSHYERILRLQLAPIVVIE